jgi:hypothetical protein
MLARVRRFTKLVFRPFSQAALNVMGLAGVTGGAAWLWIQQHGTAAALLGLGTLAMLLALAGYRSQKQLDQVRGNQVAREFIARHLYLGQGLESQVLGAAKLDVAMEAANVEPYSDLWDQAMEAGEKAGDSLDNWERTTEVFLKEQAGWDYYVRFRSDSGLPDTPMPGADYREEWKEVWRRLHCRMQRLQEFIKEIPQEPTG